MNVMVFDPHIDSRSVEALECIKVDLKSLRRKSQYVLVACPLTNETMGLLGEKELKMMRSDSILVNAARAGIVEERALIKALNEQLDSHSGAGCDRKPST